MLFYLMTPPSPCCSDWLSSWRSLSSTSPGRHSFGFASNGSALFRFGGVDAGGLTRGDVAGFSLSAHSWSPAIPNAVSRSRGCTISYRNGSILHGFGVDDTATPLSDVWLFDSVRSVWSRVATAGAAPAARHSLSCVLLANEELLIFGGVSASGAALTDAFVLNGTVWTSLRVIGSAPQSVGSSAAFIPSLSGVALHGGRTSGAMGAGVVSAAHFGSLGSGSLSWTQIYTTPSLSRALAGSFSLHAQPSLCEVGGIDSVMSSPHALSSIVCLILATEVVANSTAPAVRGRWLLLPVSSGGVELQPRYAHGAALVNESLLFVHSGSNGDSVLGDTLVIALPRMSEWLSLTTTPTSSLSTTIIFISVCVALGLLLFSSRFFQVMRRLVRRQTRSSGSDTSPTSRPEPRTLLQIRAAAGVSQRVIESLPKFLFDSERDSGSVGAACTICLAAFSDGDELSTLECVHSFHRDCLAPWLRDTASCPLCRTVVASS
jgi:hypothetical protein